MSAIFGSDDTHTSSAQTSLKVGGTQTGQLARPVSPAVQETVVETSEEPSTKEYIPLTRAQVEEYLLSYYFTPRGYGRPALPEDASKACFLLEDEAEYGNFMNLLGQYAPRNSGWYLEEPWPNWPRRYVVVVPNPITLGPGTGLISCRLFSKNKYILYWKDRSAQNIP
jgi:hypothetical protein